MGRLGIFNFVTLNGFFEGPGRDISWHRHGEEENAFSQEGLKSGSTLLFGRVTYQMMASFWPMPDALKMFPDVALGMNSAEKIVFSRTLKTADWSNTRIVQGDVADEIRKLKNQGKNMTVLGSGSIVTQLADHNLIDEYAIMVDPVALGAGTPMFKGLTQKLDLKLTGTRAFTSGVVLLTYQPLTA